MWKRNIGQKRSLATWLKNPTSVDVWSWVGVIFNRDDGKRQGRSKQVVEKEPGGRQVHRLGVNHYRDNHYQWPPLPHDNQYQWQSVPHDDHHHMTTINMPCTINTCHHYHVLFCKKIITTWQSPPHDNHYLMTTTTTYLPTHSFGQMSPNYNSVRAGNSLIWFILLFAVQTLSKHFWKILQSNQWSWFQALWRTLSRKILI